MPFDIRSCTTLKFSDLFSCMTAVRLDDHAPACHAYYTPSVIEVKKSVVLPTTYQADPSEHHVIPVSDSMSYDEHRPTCFTVP
ncbi:hypothetical protein M378DRAFT_171675 [Amanita muscaria Koide BX008]|uniref:Uncharacterized protein n=1 Tax=Amanita muscaria (strain Koide BX008) TaxID=946122 RepID=A0A0C2WMV1_AMAMK|nr:hypothetical protein M378DRAFT_171675 [Amanita muscaria Koide BX008]